VELRIIKSKFENCCESEIAGTIIEKMPGDSNTLDTGVPEDDDSTL